MKHQFGVLLAVSLCSANAQAYQQLGFEGHLVASTGNLSVGDRFSGQFTFSPDTPDDEGYLADMLGQSAGQIDGPVVYFRNYQNQQFSSFSINGGEVITGTQSLGWALVDNALVQTSLSPDAFMSGGSNLFDGYVTSGTYDIISLRAIHTFTRTGVNTLGGPLYSGVIFGITAIFAPDTFTLDGRTPPIYQTPFSGQPVFLGYEIYGPDYSALGIFDQANANTVDTVPLPGTAWLFGSALTGLVLRLRKRR